MSQPPPKRNNSQDCQTATMYDLRDRREMGIQKYGTALQPFNGRNAAQDLYEELLDATVYTKQMITEYDTMKLLLHEVIAEVNRVDAMTKLDPSASYIVIGLRELADRVSEVLNGET